MVLIKDGIVWGQWQAGPSVQPIVESILGKTSFEEISAVLCDLKAWDPEEPVSA
jgi:hypothetical protein